MKQSSKKHIFKRNQQGLELVTSKGHNFCMEKKCMHIFLIGNIRFLSVFWSIVCACVQRVLLLQRPVDVAVDCTALGRKIFRAEQSVSQRGRLARAPVLTRLHQKSVALRLGPKSTSVLTKQLNRAAHNRFFPCKKQCPLQPKY